MTRKAAWQFDHGNMAGPEANVAKMAAADAGLEACDIAYLGEHVLGLPRSY